MRKLNLIISLMAGVILSTQVSAAVIDFSVYHAGIHGTTLATPESTINSLASNLFISASDSGERNSICALTDNFFCSGDFEIIFNELVNTQSLETFGWQLGDIVTISAFDAGGSLLGSVVQSSNGLADLSAFSGVKRLLFDDASTAAGMSYDFITYNVTAVPVPAAVWLFGSGMLGLVGVVRQKKPT